MSSIAVGNGLGTAIHLGEFEHNTPEWHDLRAAMIGSSDVPVIFGYSSKSAFTLWHEKNELITPEPPDDNLQLRYDYGHYMEPFVAQQFLKRHPDNELVISGTWQHKDRAWQGCNPDRLIYDPEADQYPGILEIKTAPSLSDWADGPPPGYRLQLLWQLDTFGWQRGILGAWFNMNARYEEYPVEVDPFEMGAIRARVKAFAESLTEGEPPEIDGSNSTYQTVRKLNPSIPDPKAVKEIPKDVAIAYQVARIRYKDAEEDLLKWKGHMLAHMGTAKYAEFEGTRLARRDARGGGVPFLKEVD